MPYIVEYLLKVSIALAVVYAFYQFFLRRLTFYNWNRWYLVGYSLLCFCIPFLNITNFLFHHELQQSTFVQIVPVFSNIQIIRQEQLFWNKENIMLVVFVLGISVMMIRLFIQLFFMKRMQKSASLLSTGGVNLYHVNENIVPFSFYNSIYINKALHTEAELQEIIRHEFVHVKQRHSVDILLAELLVIILWFNPFAWLIRKAIRQNLEFIADHKVLEEGVDRKLYQYMLLKVMGNTQFSIAQKFNFSSLKNRIAMMNKIKSAKVQLLRFMFILPLIAVLLLAFRSKHNENSNKKASNDFSVAVNKIQVDTVPAPPPLPNDDVVNMNVMKNDKEEKVDIELKNGKHETYNLKDAKQKTAFEKKYGKLPPPPPPVPAAPDVQTVSIENKNGIETVTIVSNGKSESYNLNDPKEKAEMERKYGDVTTTTSKNDTTITIGFDDKVIAEGKPIANDKGYYITVADNDGECVVIVKDKNKKIVEAVLLTDWNNEKGKYEEKYGEIQCSKTINIKETKENKVQGKVISFSSKTAMDALYIIDGKEASKEDIDKINPSDVESVSVLKDKSAIAVYGEKGKNGVIMITMKKKTASLNLKKVYDVISLEPNK